jgi:hypothetical protein
LSALADDVYARRHAMESGNAKEVRPGGLLGRRQSAAAARTEEGVGG